MKRNKVEQLADIGCPHSVTVPDGKSITFFSGQTALSPHWQVQGGDTVVGQAPFAVANLKLALGGIEASVENVAKLTIYVIGMSMEVATGLSEVLAAEGLGDCATTVIGVSGIGIAGCMIEIDATVAH